MILDGGLLYDGQTIQCDGLLFLGDLHLGSTRPGWRIETDWPAPLLRKLAFCADLATDRNLFAVGVGDLFSRATEQRESVKVKAVRQMRRFPYIPIYDTGNHDTNDERIGDEDSIVLLGECDVIHVVPRAGPVARFRIGSCEVGLGMSPYGTPIPERSPEVFADADRVIWVTHHDLAFQGAYPGAAPLVEIPGCDLVVNGHMHLTKDPVRVGETTWLNVGSMIRDAIDLVDHVPVVWIFDGARLEPIELPHERNVFHRVGRLVSPTPEAKVEADVRRESADKIDTAFVTMLAQDAPLEVGRTDDGAIVRDEMGRICEGRRTGGLARAILDGLLADVVSARSET